MRHIIAECPNCHNLSHHIIKSYRKSKFICPYCNYATSYVNGSTLNLKIVFSTTKLQEVKKWIYGYKKKSF